VIAAAVRQWCRRLLTCVRAGWEVVISNSNTTFNFDVVLCSAIDAAFEAFVNNNNAKIL